MPQPDPDITTILTALRMSRTLAQQCNGDLRYFYDCQTNAIAALNRIVDRLQSTQYKVASPSVALQPLTESQVQAAACPSGT